VRRPLLHAFGGCGDLATRQSGKQTVVSGTRVTGIVEERIELALSEGVPAKLTRTWRDRKIEIRDIRYEKRGGALAPAKFKMEVREKERSARLEVSVKYQKVRDLWLPESISIKAGPESARLVVGRCDINTGLAELKCGEPTGAAPAR
jgi:hypothetical protein